MCEAHGEDKACGFLFVTLPLISTAGNFKIELIFQDDQVRVEGTLPVPIAGFFSLRVRFSNSVREENTDISDSSLANTNRINVVVPKEKLPSFNRFQASVAIRSNDETGPFTAPSNILGKFVLYLRSNGLPIV